MRVILFAPYPPRSAPSQRFRFEQYISPLAREGISIEVFSLLDAEEAAILQAPDRTARKGALLAQAGLRRLRQIVSGRAYDIAFVHREAFPIGPPVIEAGLRRLSVPYIYDFDDAIYLPSVSDANRRLARLKYPSKVAGIVRGARTVIAGNRHLAEWARTWNPAVEVIPTTIDTDRYVPQEPISRNAQLTVGWSGSQTTAEHLTLIAPLLASLQKERGIGLRVIGVPDYSIPGAELEALPWREKTEVSDLSAIDIGVMPLPDSDWARGKCGLKALQYMALGIPTVMSPVGVNREIAAGGAALLADTQTQWRTAIISLLEDPGRRAAVAAAGRARVEERYSVGATIAAYRKAIRRAAQR